MKRIGWFLIFLVLFVVACAPAGGQVDQFGQQDEAPLAESETAAPATAVAVPEEDSAAEGETTAPAGDGSDPLQPRADDWRKSAAVDPAVTVIE